MPIRPCPECGHDAPRDVEAASRNAHVIYYRCADCGHVWCVPKDRPDAVPQVVAQGRKPSR